MDQKMNIINSLLVTVDQISVSGIENHERILGIASGLRTLRAMIQQDAQAGEKEEKADG